MPTSHGWSRVRVRQAVFGCVLDGDADAAARGIFDGLFGLVVEVIVIQAAMGRSQGGEVGYGSTRDPPTRQDAAHDQGQHRVAENVEGVQEAGRKEKGPGMRCARLLTQVEMCKEGRKGANVSTGADTKTNTVGRRRTRGR